MDLFAYSNVSTLEVISPFLKSYISAPSSEQEPQLQEVRERNFAVCDVFREGLEEAIEEKRFF